MRVLITLQTINKQKARARNNVYSLKRHRSVNSHQTGNAANPKGYHCGQFLAASRGTLAELLEGGIGSEPYGGVCALPHHLKPPREQVGSRQLERSIPRGTVHDKFLAHLRLSRSP